MKINYLLITIILFLRISNPLYGQNIELKGKITDSKSNEVIEFASVIIKNKTIGTVSNSNGDFVFHIPVENIKDTILISCLGYKSNQFVISNNKGKWLNIKLEPVTFKLNEIVVKPIVPLEVIKKAIDKIPENYPVKPVRLNTFVREMLNENGRFVQLTEAACMVNYAPYHIEINKLTQEKAYYLSGNKSGNFHGKSVQNYYDNYVSDGDQAKVIELRTNQNQSKLLSPYYIIGGPLNILSADKVKFKNDFMDADYFTAYKYNLVSISEYNGKEVYIIEFEPKTKRTDSNPGYRKFVYKRKFDKAPFKGKMYIETGSHAFVGFEYSLAEIYDYNGKYEHLKYDIKIDYRELGGKWYIYQIKKEDKHVEFSMGNNKKEIFDTVTAYSQILVNNMILDGFESFNRDEIIPNSDRYALCAWPSKYNAEFWDNYNTIIPNNLEQKVINDLSENESLTNQFKNSQIRDTTLKAPIAKKLVECDTLPFEVICDDYDWMKNSSSKDVLEYLIAENKYADNYMRQTRNLQERLVKEMIRNTFKSGEIKYRKVGDCFYYERYSDSSEYQILYRKKGSRAGTDEKLIEFNEQAKNYPYFSADEYSVKPDNSMILYLIDKTGNEIYNGYFYDLTRNCKVIDSLQNIFEFEWIGNNGFVYSKDNEQGKSRAIYYHEIGNSQQNDKIIYQVSGNESLSFETDKAKKFIIINHYSDTENEILYSEIQEIFKNEYKVVTPLQKNHFYEAQFQGKNIFILTNKSNPNKQIYIADIENPDEKKWKILFSNPENELIKSFQIVDNILIIKTIKNANERLIIFDYVAQKIRTIEFEEPCEISVNSIDYENHAFEFIYSSLRVPYQYYTYDLNSFKYIRKTSNAPETKFDSDNYRLERLWINSTDSTKIPVTLLYRKNEINYQKAILQALSKPYDLKGNHNMLLTAYGSNGQNFTVGYNPAVISLVDRGFIYAIAHVRGGSELGEEWHSGGKNLKKKNSFNDFIDCARYLVNQRYTSKDKLVIEGGSAGGTLIGYTVNNFSNFIKAAILDVPSINILESVLDTTYRLHSHFISELGNPYNHEEYNYMKSYSPYQNLEAIEYPSILLTSGYVDQRARYWQSAMYIAKLRQLNTSNNIILYKTDFNSGHVGPSGKYENFERIAYKYAFILDILGEN